MNPAVREKVVLSWLWCFCNMTALLNSRRIGCVCCGHVFEYDGTERTEPPTIDGLTGWCVECGHFSLIGDAVWNFSDEELQEVAAGRKKIREGDDWPLLARLLMEADGNAGLLRQQGKAYCFSCRKRIFVEPQMLTDVYGGPVPDSQTVLCPVCLAPTLIAEKSVSWGKEVSGPLKDPPYTG